MVCIRFTIVTEVHTEFVSFFSEQSTSLMLLMLKKSFDYYELLDQVNALPRDSNSNNLALPTQKYESHTLRVLGHR